MRISSLTLAGIISVALSGQTPAPEVSAPVPGQPARPRGVERPARDRAPEIKGSGRVRGRVTIADSGTPARRGEVRLTGGALREGRSTRTDSEGRYEFRDLPAGRYWLSVRKTGFVMVTGRARAMVRTSEVELANDSVATENVTLIRGGVIVGRVLDEYGDPAADVRVMAQQSRWLGGRRRLVPAGTDLRSDDIGQFRLFGLGPGDYVVSATLREGGIMSAPEDVTTGYAPTYFPGTHVAADAQAITVQAGQEIAIGDFQLAAVRTLRIGGIVLTSQGRPASGVQLMLRDDPRQAMGITFGSGRMARSAPDGTFTIANVPPGHYVLDAREGDRDEEESGGEFGSVSITAVEGDVTGVTIMTHRGATIAGQIIFEGSSPPKFRQRLVRLSATPPFGEATFLRDRARPAISPDWTFELAGLAGRRLFRATMDSPESQYWMMKAALLNGTDVSDTGIEFKATERVEGLEIVMTSRIPEISGTVTDSQGRPVAEYAVLLFPTDPERWEDAGRFRRVLRADQEGRFKARAIPPGDYLLMARESISDADAGSPEFLEQASQVATRVRVGEGETKNIVLKLAN